MAAPHDERGPPRRRWSGSRTAAASRSSGTRAMMKSSREASRSRASALELSILMLTSTPGAAPAPPPSPAPRDRSPGRDRAKRDVAAPARAEVGEFLLRLPDLQQHRARLARQGLAKRGQTDAARQTLAKRRLEQRSISAIMREAAGCDMFTAWAAALTVPVSSIAAIQPQMREFQTASRRRRRQRLTPPPGPERPKLVFIPICRVVPHAFPGNGRAIYQLCMIAPCPSI